MGEKMLRFVVNEVNKMLNADYNMISFDSLSRNSLLQICADCLNKLDAIPKVTIVLKKLNIFVALLLYIFSWM